MSPVADYKEAEQADFDKLKAFLKEVLWENFMHMDKNWYDIKLY